MTMERAIEILKHRAECDLCLNDGNECEKCDKEPISYSELKDAYAKVEAAALKQAPYKPKRYRTDGYICSCGVIMFNKIDFCNKCGQALDWGDHKTEKGGAE